MWFCGDIISSPSDGNIQTKTVLKYMADLTAIMDEYTSGISQPNSSGLIGDQINFVQHCLLSLPPQKSLKRGMNNLKGYGEIGKKFALYEVTRLAAICYSQLVTISIRP